jgi:ribosomal protein L40E
MGLSPALDRRRRRSYEILPRGLFMKICPFCQAEIQAAAHKCRHCGEWLDEEYADLRRKSPDLGDDVGMRLLLPVGRSGWAIAAGYLGLISVLCVPSPLALIAGILAIREMRRDPKKHGMGRAVFGIIMGSVGTVLLVIFVAALIMESWKRR